MLGEQPTAAGRPRSVNRQARVGTGNDCLLTHSRSKLSSAHSVA